jgi:DNA repair photolyase
MEIIYEPKGKAKEYCNLAVNLYKGCNHGCKYCYAPSATFTKRKKFNNHQEPRKNIIEKLKKDAEKHPGNGQQVLLSFTSDPYQHLDQELQLTRQAIKIL